jgi:hypothetical protein
MVATEIDAAQVLDPTAKGFARYAGHNENEVVPLRLGLELEISDPEVLAELQRHPRGAERERFALQALRIGVMSLRMASGQVDAGAIRASGEKLVADVRELLAAAAARMTGEMKATLGGYLDPESGSFEQRVKALVAGDGELARLLDSHLGEKSSVLARTLAGSLGEGSELFRLLSPSDTAGVRAQLARLLEDAIGRQREQILREFSLDAKDSALSRLVDRLEGKHGELEAGFKKEAGALLAELSLDQPDSALSRLVKRVETAQQTLTGEFSLDNQGSALSRLQTSLRDAHDALAKKNDVFHTEMREAIAALRAQREEAERSTRHGAAFETALGEVLQRLASKRADILEPTGNKTGLIKNCKVGDHVVELGPDRRAPGARIVWEAKEERGYALKDALSELAVARGNRGAQLGVFVFSKKTAPAGLETFERYGQDFVVVWDAEDPTSDALIRLAYLAADALAVAHGEDDEEVRAALEEIERAARAIHKQVPHCEELQKLGASIRSQAERIEERARKMVAELTRQVEALDEQVEAFRQQR